MPTQEKLDALYQALRDVVTNPEFQRVLAEIQSLPPSERLQAVSTQLTSEALAARGIQIPEGCTITTHVLQDLVVPNTGIVHNTAIEKKSAVCFTIPGTNIQICSPVLPIMPPLAEIM